MTKTTTGSQRIQDNLQIPARGRKAVEPCIYICENGRYLVAVSSEGERKARAAATLAEARKTREQLRRDIMRHQKTKPKRKRRRHKRRQ